MLTKKKLKNICFYLILHFKNRNQHHKYPEHIFKTNINRNLIQFHCTRCARAFRHVVRWTSSSKSPQSETQSPPPAPLPMSIECGMCLCIVLPPSACGLSAAHASTSRSVCGMRLILGVCAQFNAGCRLRLMRPENRGSGNGRERERGIDCDFLQREDVSWMILKKTLGFNLIRYQHLLTFKTWL